MNTESITIGALYTVQLLPDSHSTSFMVSVYGEGWKFCNVHTSMLMVLAKNVDVNVENSDLINVRVLLNDGTVGVYWAPERLRLIDGKTCNR